MFSFYNIPFLNEHACQRIVSYKMADYNRILTSVRVEPTNAACAPSTAMSDALNHYTTEASKKRMLNRVYNEARFCSTLRIGVLRVMLIFCNELQG